MKIIYKSGSIYYLGELLSKPNAEMLNVAYMSNENIWNPNEFKPKFTVVKVSPKNIINLDELDSIVKDIQIKRASEIAELYSQLKSTKREDYLDEVEKEYDRLKTEILRTATNMVENEIDDDSFENRLKSICRMKKQLFSIPCDEAREARKFNGTVKHKIKKINDEYDKQMNLLDLDNWQELIS